MNNNQTTQKQKPNHKGKAIASFVIGLIGIVFIIFACAFPMHGVSMIILFGAFFIAFIGLLLGIKGLKFPKKALAILVIILCTSTLLFILRIFGFLGKTKGAFLGCPF